MRFFYLLLISFQFIIYWHNVALFKNKAKTLFLMCYNYCYFPKWQRKKKKDYHQIRLVWISWTRNRLKCFTATLCAKYKNNCVSHVWALKDPVGKSHSIASRSLLMVEHETGNVTAKIRGQAVCLAMLTALFILRSGRTQQGITNFSPI